MSATAFIARGLSKNGVRSFIETDLTELNNKEDKETIVITDDRSFEKQFSNLRVIYIKPCNKFTWDNLFLTKKLIELKAKKVIYTKNIIPFIHLLFSWEKVVYVLDLAFMYKNLHAYKFFDSLYMRIFFNSSIRGADKIVAISKFTKSEIINFFPKIDPKKIDVRYLLVNKIFKRISNKIEINNIIKKYGLKIPFIFYCGSISPRKNILNLLKAFNLVKNDISHDLYLLSSRNWNADNELNFLNKELKNRAKIIKNVSDEELAVFYSIADLFVYPSLYEGFGLPTKEAEACGCRVLTSNFGVMKEVVGGKTRLVDTKDIKKFTEIILKELK